MSSTSGKTNQIDLNIPPKVLVGTITQTTPLEPWPYPNAADDPWYASGTSPKPYQWQLEITVTPQEHGSNLTRDDYEFNGYDVRVGDWIGYLADGACLKVVSVTSKSRLECTVIAEDYLRYNTFRDPNGEGRGAGTNIAIFTTNERGVPILDSEIGSASTIFFRNVTSRFEYLNSQYNYVLNQQNHNFQPGDVISVTSDGYVRGNAQTASKMVGVVSQVGPGPHNFMINPNQQIIDFRPDIPGSQGDFVYLDGDGDLTLGGGTATQKLTYLIVSSRIPTVLTGDVVDPSITPGTTIELNGESITFTGTGSLGDIVSDINQVTANTNVTAFAATSPTNITSSAAGTAYGLVGGFAPFSAYFDTGSGNTLVNFTTTTAGQATYGQPVAIPADMKTDIDAAGIANLTVRLDSVTQFSLIEENGNAISITNATNDINNNPFVGASNISGLPVNTVASTDKLLRLTESRGGEINIYDSSLTFTPATGVFSGHTGRPVTAMNIEQGVRAGGLYVVPDVSARDNLNAIVGDQAYVLNKGDGEWGLYVYDGSNWVQTADQDSADVDAKTLVATYDAAVDGGNTVIALGSLSVGRKITMVGMEVNTAFNGTPYAELTIESQDGNTIITDATESDMNTQGRYVSTPNFVHGDPGGQEFPVVANVTLNGATTGNVTIRLTYV